MIGYGSQGRAEALNLKDSGMQLQIGVRPGPSFERAKADGFQTASNKDVFLENEVVFINAPDESQGEIFNQIPKAAKVKYLVFAHGFAIHFKQIDLSKRPELTAVLIAPKGAASGLRSLYKTPRALPSILALRDSQPREATLEEKKWIEELAISVGCHPQFLIWAQFKDEAVCDLFAEQALLCGGVSSLLLKSFETLVEAGYDSKTAYFETLFELKLIVDLIWENGISGMRDRISPTARYGDITRGDRIIDNSVKEKMKQVLKEVEDGRFAQEFLAENKNPAYLNKIENLRQHPLEELGRNLRS